MEPALVPSNLSMAILRDFFTFNLALFELVNNIYYIEP